MKYAITGATGKLGQHVINHLLQSIENPSQIYAIVRDLEKARALKEKGVNIIYGEYSKPDSLKEALKGIDRLLLISGSEVGKRAEQHKNIIEAAKANDVKFIAYTSILNSEHSHLKLAEEHLSTEEEIKNSQIPYSFLRNGWYTENYLEQIPSILSNGAILGAAKDGRFSAAPRESYAKAAVKVLTHDEPVNTVYELAGDYSFNLEELASILTKASGTQIQYVDLPSDEYAQKLISFQIPEAFANVLADSDLNAANGELFSESTDLKELNQEAIPSLETLIKSYL